MKVGIGLPNTIAGIAGDDLLDIARRADAGPFSNLSVLDRLQYDSYDPLITLAAVAPVTQRVRLATIVAIPPLRNAAQLAKQAASLDALSGGRLVLGLAVGARESDYQAAGVPTTGRGAKFDEQLAQLRQHWQAADFGPKSGQKDGPQVLIGGSNDAAFARMARYADGYVHGGGPPRLFARDAERARAAWRDAGRPGQPELWGMGYFALGDEATTVAGADYLRDYYAFTGPFAESIARGLLTTSQAVTAFVRGYAEAGCEELALYQALPDPEQVDRLADVIG